MRAACWISREGCGENKADRRIGVRPFTFFEKGVVGHVGFADPFDEKIAAVCEPPASAI